MSGHSTHSEATDDDDDDFSTIKGHDAERSFSDDEDDTNEEWLKQGDYSSRLEEILSDDQHSDSDEFHYDDGEDDDDDEGFVYSGKDVDAPRASYEEQLRDVLEGDMDSDDEIHGNAFATGDHSFASVSHHADVSIEVSSPQVRVLSSLFLASITRFPAGSPF